ncbi:MAG: carboxy-S-adenosyl-L-methionine synthase CmoA [Candidatus Omnitrophica bacterium]|nr:carboxy-S-adenosyl-L-methionine synthase CmoA [Candidatus Omnitrophota bacterium]
MKDDIFSKSMNKVEPFVFDDKVVKVFDDMIRRSVPGYAPIIGLIGILAEQYVKPNTLIYDLGCSTGACTLSMRKNIKHSDCKIIAVDNSYAMVEQCKKNIKADAGLVPVEVLCADLRDIKVENASMVVMNFTLQFIAPVDRLKVIQKIHDGILPGGIFIISEKIKFNDPVEDKAQTELYYAYKKMNGYSDLEISQKRTALEEVLIPDTLEEHFKRLKVAGFQQAFVWFQCFNFVSIVAFK